MEFFIADELFGGQEPQDCKSFEQTYQCYSMSFMDKPQIENGDRIIMPHSALDQLASTHADYPMLFELHNAATTCVSHCSVLEFTAEEGMIYMPYWMMENLLLQEGDNVQVKNVTLPKGTYVRLQPHAKDFLDISNPKPILETMLRNFSCLTTGNSVMVSDNDKKYYMDIIETKPSDAVCIMETDCEVDFAPPLSYKELKKPVDAVMSNNTAAEDLMSFSGVTDSPESPQPQGEISTSKPGVPDQEREALNISDGDESGSATAEGVKDSPKSPQPRGEISGSKPGVPDQKREAVNTSHEDESGSATAEGLTDSPEPPHPQGEISSLKPALSEREREAPNTSHGDESGPATAEGKSLFEAKVQSFLTKLTRDEVSFEDHDFSAPTEDVVKTTGGFHLPRALAVILDKVVAKHSNFLAGVKQNKFSNQALSTFCAAVWCMTRVKLEDVSEELLLKWRDAFADAECFSFDLQFAKDALKRIALAYFGLSARVEGVLEVEEIDARLSALRADIEALEKKRASLLNSEFSGIRGECVSVAASLEGQYVGNILF
ncbi:hypothetical protein NMG60_11019513 [Bertholletia excelsa]